MSSFASKLWKQWKKIKTLEVIWGQAVRIPNDFHPLLFTTVGAVIKCNLNPVCLSLLLLLWTNAMWILLSVVDANPTRIRSVYPESFRTLLLHKNSSTANPIVDYGRWRGDQTPSNHLTQYVLSHTADSVVLHRLFEVKIQPPLSRATLCATFSRHTSCSRTDVAGKQVFSAVCRRCHARTSIASIACCFFSSHEHRLRRRSRSS